MARVYMIRGNIYLYPKDAKPYREKCLGFVRSELQAKKAVIHISENMEFEEVNSVHYTPEDIPNDKDGLIKWLNKYSFDFQNVDELIKEVLEEY